MNNLLDRLFGLVSMQKPEYRIIVVGVGIVILCMISPTHLDNLPPLCLWKNLLGVECLACGTTHALASFFDGNVVQAFDYNKNIIITGPLFILLFTRDLVYLLKKQVVRK